MMSNRIMDQIEKIVKKFFNFVIGINKRFPQLVTSFILSSVFLGWCRFTIGLYYLIFMDTTAIIFFREHRTYVCLIYFSLVIFFCNFPFNIWYSIFVRLAKNLLFPLGWRKEFYYTDKTTLECNNLTVLPVKTQVYIRHLLANTVDESDIDTKITQTRGRALFLFRLPKFDRKFCSILDFIRVSILYTWFFLFVFAEQLFVSGVIIMFILLRLVFFYSEITFLIFLFLGLVRSIIPLISKPFSGSIYIINNLLIYNERLKEHRNSDSQKLEIYEFYCLLFSRTLALPAFSVFFLNSIFHFIHWIVGSDQSFFVKNEPFRKAFFNPANWSGARSALLFWYKNGDFLYSYLSIAIEYHKTIPTRGYLKV